MSKKSIVSTAVPATQDEMATAERAFLDELVQVMPAWYDYARPGVDVAFYGLEQLLVAGDRAAAAFDDDKNDAAIPPRWAALQAMRSAVRVAWPLSITRRRELRKKQLKRHGVTDDTSYERRTVALVAADIPAWYTEAGLWGVLRSLYETCKLVREVFGEIAEDSTVSDEKKLFVAAFEVRRRLGKVSDAEFKALEMLSEKSGAVAA